MYICCSGVGNWLSEVAGKVGGSWDFAVNLITQSRICVNCNSLYIHYLNVFTAYFLILFTLLRSCMFALLILVMFSIICYMQLSYNAFPGT